MHKRSGATAKQQLARAEKRTLPDGDCVTLNNLVVNIIYSSWAMVPLLPQAYSLPQAEQVRGPCTNKMRVTSPMATDSDALYRQKRPDQKISSWIGMYCSRDWLNVCCPF